MRWTVALKLKIYNIIYDVANDHNDFEFSIRFDIFFILRISNESKF